MNRAAFEKWLEKQSPNFDLRFKPCRDKIWEYFSLRGEFPRVVVTKIVMEDRRKGEVSSTVKVVDALERLWNGGEARIIKEPAQKSKLKGIEEAVAKAKHICKTCGGSGVATRFLWYAPEGTSTVLLTSARGLKGGSEKQN